VTGSRAIRSLSAALAFLAVTLTGPGWTQAPARDCIIHEKGKVRAGLPLYGSLGPCGGVGLRWPGPGGDEYLGGGGLFLRFMNAAGERVAHGTFEAVALETGELFDGCVRGKRFPHPLRDDDYDGLIDEDPMDGGDNDGDGFIDEDFAAIGDEMHVTVAIDRESGLIRRQNSYTWTFGHVRDFIGFTTSIISPGRTTGLLRNLEAVLYADFRIGDENDSSRGENDLFFVIEKEWEGGTLRLPAARDGERFVALLLLDAVGPRGEELGAQALLVRATDTLWALLDLAGGNEEGLLRIDPHPVRVLPRAEEGGAVPERQRAAGGSGVLEGEGAIACLLEPLPEFWPGDELTVHWAVVFGNSESKLVKNALRALETYEGLPDGEGALHRWIVPARRAARIELEAHPAVVWSQGNRQPAATIVLPSPLEEEEVEWLRGLNAAALQYQQVDGKILVTVEGPIDVETILIEGQLTDGTLFTATLLCDTLLGTEDGSRTADGLPDDSVQLYPNPFLTSLNINLRVFDSALTQEAAGSSSVRIYDVRGRLVRTILEQGPLHPGEYLRTWDGLDEYGKDAAPGVYYVKLQIGDRSVTKRVILLR
jgi:hypothetical protein